VKTHNGYGYGTLVVQRALEQAGGASLDLEASRAAMNDALVALTKQAKALAEADYGTLKPDVVGKTFAYTAKVVDEIVRLSEFAKGNPDSRQEVLGLETIFNLLPLDQLNDVIAKMEAQHLQSLAAPQKLLQEAEIVHQ
jgi:hypothetical protein